jgi:type II secretory pathway predicted ATPase ExeA
VEHHEHFSLSEDPFANEPSLRFYFASPEHMDAEKRLLRGVQQAKGLSLLTGGVGTGKTTLLRRALEALDEERFELFALVVVQPTSESGWLVTRLARHLGVTSTEDPNALLRDVVVRLSEARAEGRRTVVWIDEAHLLRAPVLAELRGLLNLEDEEGRLLSFVLVGLPELASRVAADPAIGERVDLRVALASLGQESAIEYLEHRIRVAGGDTGILDPEAVVELVRHARGVPRHMNTLADNALFEAYLASRDSVLASDVERAASELGLAAQPPGAEPGEASAAPRASAHADDPLEATWVGRSALRADAEASRGAASASAPHRAPEAAGHELELVHELGQDEILDEPDVDVLEFDSDAPSLAPEDGPPKEEEIEEALDRLLD